MPLGLQLPEYEGSPVIFHNPLQTRASRVALPPFRIAALLCGLSCLSIESVRADPGLIPAVTAIPRLEESSTLTFAAFQVERYDSNFFRLNDSVDTPDKTRRSVLTSVTGVGLNVDKRYGLQRLEFNASTSREIYAPYHDLNDTGSRVDSTFYWSITPSLTGNLLFDYTRSPTDYEYLGFVTRPNPRTSRLTRLNIDFKPGAAIHPRLSLYEARNESQNATFQLDNSRATGLEAALLYDFVSTNTVGIYANRSKGRNLNSDFTSVVQADASFRQTEFGVLAEWRASGASKFNGRVGYTRYDDDNLSGADFTGTIGEIGYTYDLTGKTRLRLSAKRTLFSSQTSFSNYAQEDDGLVGIEWAATNKILVKPSFAVRRQQFKGSPAFLSTSGTSTTNTTFSEISRYYTLEADWAAFRSTDLAFSIARSRRISTDALQTFVDYNASVFARFKF